MPHAVASAYQDSSQYKRWRFSAEELASKRESLHQAAVTECAANITLETELAGKAPNKAADFPSWEEELLHVNFYARKLAETAAVFGLPLHLKATAAQYVKRFYLMRSVLQYHPKTIMVTCLFLATKTCEHYVPLETFATKLKMTKEAIIQHEFEVSSTILFDYVHWSAYRPLHGFVLDMEASMSGDADKISKAHEQAKALVNAITWSDLPFFHLPSHLALAALLHSNEELTLTYLDNKELGHLVDVLKPILQAMKDAAAETTDLNAVKAVDKKIYYSSDPAMKPESALSKQRRAQEDSEGQAKRRVKDEAARQSSEAFGKVLQ